MTKEFQPVTKELQLVLMSKRPGGSWGIRNRCVQLQNNLPKLKKELKRLRARGAIVEPDTEFKLKWVRRPW